eukprot:3113401-Pyramimonas_sp.AAC.1
MVGKYYARTLMYQLACRRAHPYAVVGPVVVNIAVGGSSYGATKRVKGVPKCRGAATRALSLGPHVELPMAPRNV